MLCEPNLKNMKRQKKKKKVYLFCNFVHCVLKLLSMLLLKVPLVRRLPEQRREGGAQFAGVAHTVMNCTRMVARRMQGLYQQNST